MTTQTDEARLQEIIDQIRSSGSGQGDEARLQGIVDQIRASAPQQSTPQRVEYPEIDLSSYYQSQGGIPRQTAAPATPVQPTTVPEPTLDPNDYLGSEITERDRQLAMEASRMEAGLPAREPRPDQPLPPFLSMPMAGIRSVEDALVEAFRPSSYQRASDGGFDWRYLFNPASAPESRREAGTAEQYEQFEQAYGREPRWDERSLLRGASSPWWTMFLDPTIAIPAPFAAGKFAGLASRLGTKAAQSTSALSRAPLVAGQAAAELAAGAAAPLAAAELGMEAGARMGGRAAMAAAGGVADAAGRIVLPNGQVLIGDPSIPTFNRVHSQPGMNPQADPRYEQAYVGMGGPDVRPEIDETARYMGGHGAIDPGMIPPQMAPPVDDTARYMASRMGADVAPTIPRQFDEAVNPEGLTYQQARGGIPPQRATSEDDPLRADLEEMLQDSKDRLAQSDKDIAFAGREYTDSELSANRTAIPPVDLPKNAFDRPALTRNYARMYAKGVEGAEEKVASLRADQADLIRRAEELEATVAGRSDRTPTGIDNEVMVTRANAGNLRRSAEQLDEQIQRHLKEGAESQERLRLIQQKSPETARLMEIDADIARGDNGVRAMDSIRATRSVENIRGGAADIADNIKLREEQEQVQQSAEIAKNMRDVLEGKPPPGGGAFMEPPHSVDLFDDFIDASDPRLLGRGKTSERSTMESIMRRADGHIEVFGKDVDNLRAEFAPLYRDMGVTPGKISDLENNRMLTVLNGEADIRALTPPQQAYVRKVQRLRDAMQEESRRFYEWAMREGVDEFFPKAMREFAEGFEDIISANQDYFPWRWKHIPTEEETLSRGFIPSSRGSHTFGRQNDSFMQALQEGYKPEFNDPLAMMLAESVTRKHDQVRMVVMKRLHEQDLLKTYDGTMGDPGWRVPRVGPPFEGRVRRDGTRSASYTVPNPVADWLERAEGLTWKWTIKAGDKEVDAWRQIGRATNVLKMGKLIFSAMQHIDLAMRFGAGEFRPIANWAQLKYAAPTRIPGVNAEVPLPGVLKATPDFMEVFGWSMNVRDGRRRLNREMTSTKPLLRNVDSTRQVTPRMLVDEGMASRDTSILIRDGSQKITRWLDAEIARAESPSVVGRLRGTLDWVQESLWTAYTGFMLKYAENTVPYVAARHPDWTGRQIAAETARMVNTVFSSKANWEGGVLRNPYLESLLQRVFFSTGENRGLLATAYESLPLPSNTSPKMFADHWVGYFLFLATVANVMHFAATGKPMPARQYNPTSTDPEAPLGFGYSSQFMRIPLPFVRGRNDTYVYMDLVGQADTPFRVVLDPYEAAMARLNVTPRTLMNQIEGETYTGESIAAPYKRAIQGMIDMAAPIAAQSLMEAGRQSNLDSGFAAAVPEAEGRLGVGGNLVQSIGINLSSEPNMQVRDRATERMGLTGGYLEQETYLKRIIRKQVEPELKERAETGARRGNEWAERQERRFELDDIEQTRLYGRDGMGGIVARAKNAYTREEQRNVVNDFYSLRSEMALLRREADRQAGLSFDDEATPEGANEAALNGYYDLIEKATDEDGNFDQTEYGRMRDQYMARLPTAQRHYVERNTNLTPVPDEILRLLSPNTQARIRTSQEARERDLRLKGLSPRLLDNSP